MGFMPYINRQPTRTVTIPELGGGMNLRDSVSMINDNQITDCLNMRFSEGILKTRPALDAIPECTEFLSTGTGQIYEHTTKEIHNEVRLIIEGKEYRLNAFIVAFEENNTAEIHFNLICFDKTGINLAVISVADHTAHAFVIQDKTNIYCFVSGETIEPVIYKLSEDMTEWINANNDIYAPLVATHCVRSGWDYEGTNFEGYNLLGSNYRMTYSAYNENDTDLNHPMRYLFAMPIPDGYSGTVKAEITTYDSTKDETITTLHTVTLDGTNAACYYENFEEGKSPADGLHMYVKKTFLGFEAKKADTTPICITTDDLKKKYACSEDNITITAPCTNTADNLKKVFGMAVYTWFGGSASGLNNGTRLFLGGNNEGKEKNLIVWSDLEKPLYFPENCYAYVGNASSAVTAFGKQSDVLVIFKENELYSTRYTSGTDYTAEDLINQNVIDVTTADATFPITQINAYIGCDVPRSVQLCNNRLVWATSGGKVYTLTNDNQYSEKNVYEVSRMIERRLRTEERTVLKSAMSCDWGGFYMLFSEGRIYVMDYNSYGFNNVYSYTKTEDANLRIPWYYWEIPVKPYSVTANARDILIFAVDGTYFDGKHWSYSAAHTFNPDTKTDERINFNHGTGEAYPRPENGYYFEIRSLLQTKIFDLDMPYRNKKIPLVNIAFGNNGGNPIKVSFLTENSEREDEQIITLTESDAEKYSSQYVHNRAVRPCCPIVNRLGVRIECEGFLAVDSISFNYTALGGAR